MGSAAQTRVSPLPDTGRHSPHRKRRGERGGGHGRTSTTGTRGRKERQANHVEHLLSLVGPPLVVDPNPVSGALRPRVDSLRLRGLIPVQARALASCSRGASPVPYILDERDYLREVPGPLGGVEHVQQVALGEGLTPREKRTPCLPKQARRNLGCLGGCRQALGGATWEKREGGGGQVQRAGRSCGSPSVARS